MLKFTIKTSILNKIKPTSTYFPLLIIPNIKLKNQYILTQTNILRSNKPTSFIFPSHYLSST